MDLIQGFIEKATAAPKRIVYPEGDDERILRAAVEANARGIAKPVVLGNRDELEALAAGHDLSLAGIETVSRDDRERLERYAADYAEARDLKLGIAGRLVRKPLAFAGMMLRLGEADGMVAGVANATGSVIQAAALTIGFQEGLSTASSFFIMVLPEFRGEKNKVLIFADAAVTVSPTARQLAEIAVAAGLNARALLGLEPKIAFLSFSTKGSAVHPDTEKVVEAVRIARELEPGLECDGELQADAALVPGVAEKKAKDSPVAGRANVLIFPDLDAANIAYKLVQYLANAKAIGPILQGFRQPVNDMSRGATVEDLINVSAITVIQAQKSSGT